MEKISKGKSWLVFIISLSILLIGVTVIKANPAVCLIFAGLSAMYLGMFFGCKWATFQEDLGETIKRMFIGMLIMMFVGLLIGAWMASGTVPLMMYYGLKYLPAPVFLFASCLLCSIVSVMTGTSWGTMGTMGVALMGVAYGLGIPAGMAAGAIIVGALFGDKLSPLSDTTILAPSVCDVNIIDHIKAMLYTTIPGYVISLVMYLILGMGYTGEVIGTEQMAILNTIESNFVLNPILLLPPIIVLILIFAKKPAIPVFGIGILLGVLLAMIFQDYTIAQALAALHNGIKADTGVAIVDKMINRGGLMSMSGSIMLILGAAIFSASLKSVNVFDLLLEIIEKKAKTSKMLLVFSYILHLVLASIVGVYLVTFAIVGPILSPLFDKFGLDRRNLSRLLEDTGTAFSPLIPWSNISIFIVGTLGVTSFEYGIFAPITYLSLAMGLICTFTGFGIYKSDGNMLFTFKTKQKII